MTDAGEQGEMPVSRFPALPLWTDSYLADTAHLNDAEHGRYLRLLMLMWRSPGCRIPNDREWIEKRLGTGTEPLIKEFCQSTGNWVTQRRLLKEWNYVRVRTKKSSDAAKSRWNKEKGTSVRIAVAKAEQPPSKAPTPTPTPTPTPRKKELKTQTQHMNGSTVSLPQPPEGWEAFKENYPRKYDLRRAEAAYALALKRPGVTAGLLNAQAEAYARDCRKRKTSTEYILSPTRWLVDGRWTDEYGPVPLTKEQQERNGWDTALTMMATGELSSWPEKMLGPKPGSPGCRVPPDILAKHGLPVPVDGTKH